MTVRACPTGAVLCATLCAQAPLPAATAPLEPTKNPLGRNTLRGTVLGFLAAAGKGELRTAAQFLNTRSSGPAGEPCLFSRQTLDRIPALHQETGAFPIEDALPPLPVNTKVARALDRSAGWAVSASVRSRIVAKWALSAVSAPLLVRQSWSTTASLITITGCVWLIVILIRHLDPLRSCGAGRRDARHGRTHWESIRVRSLRFGASSLDLDGAQISLQAPVYVAPVAGSDGRNHSEHELQYQENEVSR